MSHLDAVQARRRYLILHGMRWFPTGMLIPILALLPLHRGLSLSQLGVALAMQGIVVLCLELPTGGLSDSWGRRPVLLMAGVLSLASLTIYYLADSFAAFAAAYAIQGVYRALDSGPLDAWYVDAAFADDPDADISTGLGRGGAVLGLAVAGGGLVGGGLVAWQPIPGVEALATPVVVSFATQVVGIVLTAVLMTEVRQSGGSRTALDSVREVPRVIGSTFGLLRRSRVLVALIAVELFWGFGMVTFESLMPVRMTEVLGDADAAASVMGPAASAAWLAAAGGAMVAPWLGRRFGLAFSAGATRVLQGLTVVGIGLFAGPVGVIAAYLATYVVHGAANPLHMTLLHHQVSGENRSTVVSLNSMVGQPAGSIGSIVLLSLAGATSVTTAMLVGALVLAVAAPLYVPAARDERRRAQPASSTAVTADL